MRKKLVADGSMAIAMLLLMTCGRIGETKHKWLEIFLLGLVIFHHLLNRKWHGVVEKGWYTPIYIKQEIVI